MAYIFDFFLKIQSFFLSISLQGIDLVVSFVSIFIGIVGFLNNIGHLLSFLMQLILQFFVEIVENDSFFPQTINH